MSLIYCQTDRRHFCVYMKFFIIFIRRAYYAKNKISGIHFYPYHIRLYDFIMGVYNVAIHTGGLQAATFKHALHSFPLEWFIGLLCAFFIASKTSKYFAFRVAKSTDRPIFIILCIQTFTVCTMVPLMSLLGTIESSGVTSNLIFIWLQTICLNFIMAYPLQILVVGPFCRFIFRHLFASTNQGNESKVEYEMEQ